MNQSSLVKKIWNYATILKDSGVSYTEYVRQVTYLLFLKMDYERKILLKEESMLPSEFYWNTLTDKSGAELERHYSHILDSLS